MCILMKRCCITRPSEWAGVSRNMWMRWTKFRYTERCAEKKNQLVVTKCFFALMIRSTCFGHFYAHHQELENTCMLLPPMVCSAWLSGVRCRTDSESRKRDVARLAVVQHPSSWTHSLLPCTWPPTTSNQALHAIGGNNTHIVWSSWWWA